MKEADRQGNLHKSVILEFRNESRKESFLGRMFGEYKHGIVVKDPELVE